MQRAIRHCVTHRAQLPRFRQSHKLLQESLQRCQHLALQTKLFVQEDFPATKDVSIKHGCSFVFFSFCKTPHYSRLFTALYTH